MRGSIQKREGVKGTTYLVRVEFPGDRPGERKQRARTFSSERGAQKQLTRWLSELDRQVAVEPSKITVVELAIKWLSTIASQRVKPTSVERYQATIFNHILPELGKLQAQKLTPVIVQDFYARKLASGAGARTVQLCHLRLSQVLKQGVTWNLLIRNVCEAVQPPKVESRPGKTWTSEEAKRFLAESVNDRYHPIWFVALATGMRRGEWLGLRWSDIDFEDRTIHVQQNIVPYQSGPLIQTPKTRASVRKIKLPGELLEELRRHKAKQDELAISKGDAWENLDLVFCTGNGKPINPNNLYRNAIRIMERAGVPRIRLPDMRHTHATWLLTEGMPVKVVQERLGHSKPSTTLDVYAHVMPGMQDSAAEAVSDILFRSPGSE